MITWTFGARIIFMVESFSPQITHPKKTLLHFRFVSLDVEKLFQKKIVVVTMRLFFKWICISSELLEMSLELLSKSSILYLLGLRTFKMFGKIKTVNLSLNCFETNWTMSQNILFGGSSNCLIFNMLNDHDNVFIIEKFGPIEKRCLKIYIKIVETKSYTLLYTLTESSTHIRESQSFLFIYNSIHKPWNTVLTIHWTFSMKLDIRLEPDIAIKQFSAEFHSDSRHQSQWKNNRQHQVSFCISINNFACECSKNREISIFSFRFRIFTVHFP